MAVVRLEKLYPLATSELAAALAPYENAEVVWVQDEPENQGAWFFLAMNLFPGLGLLPNFGGLAENLPSVRVISRHEGHRQATRVVVASSGRTSKPVGGGLRVEGSGNVADMPTAHDNSWAVSISKRSEDQLFGRLPVVPLPSCDDHDASVLAYSYPNPSVCTLLGAQHC